MLCAAGLVALIGIGTVERSTAIEAHLKRDITESVLVDMPDVEVSVDGRDVTLTGSVDSSQERTVLATLVHQRWGVRTVNVQRLRASEVAPKTADAGTPVGAAGNASGVAPTPSGQNPSGAAVQTTTTVAVLFSTTSVDPNTGQLSGPSAITSLASASPTTLPTTSAPTTTTAPTTTPPTTTSPTTTTPPTTTTATTTTTVARTTIPPTTVAPTTAAPTIPPTLIPPTTVPVTVAPSPAQKQLVESAMSEILGPNPIIFDRNVATVSTGSRLTIDLVADLLKANPNVAVRIESYTDNRGTPGGNQKLSERRANSVRAELMSRGVAPTQMTAVGLGEKNPIATNATEEGRIQNRRIEIVVVR